MGGDADCTDIKGYIYCVLDKIYKHATNAAQIAYTCRARDYVDRPKSTELNVEIIKALAEIEEALGKSKRYASMISAAQDVAEAMARALDQDGGAFD